MLHKLRVVIASDQPIGPHQYAYKLLSAVYHGLGSAGAEAHDNPAPNPCVVSPVLPARDEPGLYFFDVSTLDDECLDPITYRLRPEKAPLVLGDAGFPIIECGLLCSLDWQEAMTPSGEMTQFDFLLKSPTQHRQAAGKKRRCIYTPDPRLYFMSWLRRWNAFSDVKFPAETIDECLGELSVTRFRGGTEKVNWDIPRPFVGFVGSVSFGILDPRAVPAEVKVALLALARISPYCGTGCETMWGMGQTEFVEGKRS